MNRQIRVEKIIGTVKCVATCSAFEIQPVKTWNSSASRIRLLLIRQVPSLTQCYIILQQQ